MKKLLLTILIFITLLQGRLSASNYSRLANNGKDGLYARSIEQVLRLNTDQIDIGTAALIISEQWSNVVPGRKHLAELDEMAYEILDRLNQRKIPLNHQAIAVINDYLFDELGFQTVKEATNPNDLFLHTVLDNRRGYCLSLSVLYLAIAERLGLPIYGVVVPGHFFVRYDDGRIRVNIETTSKGGYADDKHYIDKFKVPLDRNGNIYMSNLDKMQSLGCFFNNLGNSYSDIENFNQAQVALERAVEINPSLAECRANLGNIYLRFGRIKDAIFEYEQSLDINPNDAKTHNNLGNAYINFERINKALRQYEYAIKLEPNFIDAYKNLANAYRKQENYSKAISTLNQAVAIEPRNAEIIRTIGDLYAEKGSYETAISKYKQALAIDRNSAESYYGLGICYNRKGKSDDEIRAYQNALAIKPDMAPALGNLGNAYFAKRKYDMAIEHYQKALRYSPDDSGIFYNIGAAYTNKKDYKDAVVYYEKAIELEPNLGSAHAGLALALYQIKEYQKAWTHLQKAEQLQADIPEGLAESIKKKIN